MNKVLNFGSLNLDYVYEVSHFVRAGETLSSGRMTTFFGGKGLNQSIALARAGGKVWHAGAVGQDGAPLIDILAQNGVDPSLIQTVDDSSGHAIIQRDPSGQNCILLFGGANQRITDEQVEHTIGAFSAGDWIILQNEINNLPAIIRKAKEKGMRVVLNPSPMDEKIGQLPLELVDLFLLNEVEAEGLSGDSDPGRAMRLLRARFPGAAVVMTLGKHGVWYQDASMEDPISHGIYRVPVVDTTAAGDTFTGFFVSCISSGESAARALEIASIASSLAVSREGAQPSIPTMEEVLSADLIPENP